MYVTLKKLTRSTGVNLLHSALLDVFFISQLLHMCNCKSEDAIFKLVSTENAIDIYEDAFLYFATKCIKARGHKFRRSQATLTKDVGKTDATEKIDACPGGGGGGGGGGGDRLHLTESRALRSDTPKNLLNQI